MIGSGRSTTPPAEAASVSAWARSAPARICTITSTCFEGLEAASSARGSEVVVVPDEPEPAVPRRAEDEMAIKLAVERTAARTVAINQRQLPFRTRTELTFDTPLSCPLFPFTGLIASSCLELDRTSA